MDKTLLFELIEVFSKTKKIDVLKFEADGMRLELESRGMVRETAEDMPVQTETPPPAKTGLHDIKSPIVGTFYERSAPDAAPYVRAGQRVNKGEVLCIVEAMKMMNEIESDIDGVVAEILVRNGDMVEFGQIIMRIEEK